MIGLARARIAHVRRYLHGDLWSAEAYQPLPRWKRFFVLLLRIALLVARGFRRERLRLRAAALTYMTLLSLVPALAVVFSVFTAFGGLKDAGARLQDVVITWLSVNQREMVAGYLDRFVGSVHAGAIGGVGVLGLLYTALSLLTNVERAFNDIWGLQEDRGLVRRFQAFWPMMTLGPVIFGVSLTATAGLEGSRTVAELIRVVPGFGALMWFGPILMTWAGFSLIYAIMPNTRVPIRCAMIGGVVGGTLWEIAKRLYGLYASHAITYSAIYGSLGAVPLFIIWIYVSWLVVLIGASLAFAAQNARTYEPDRDGEARVAQRDRDQLGARIMWLVYERFGSGAGAVSADALRAAILGPPRLVQGMLDELLAGGLLAMARTKDGKADAYLPARPAEKTSLADVLRVTRAGTTIAASPVAARPRIEGALDTAEDAAMLTLSRLSYAQLLADG